MNVKKSKHIFDGAIQTEVNNTHISYWERYGNSYGYRYDNREISYSKLEPYENQKLIISETIRIMNEKESKTSVILLSGPPGTGKSTIATFLAKELLTNKSICQNTINQVNYIDTFNPTTPGDDFGKIYRKISPTSNSPLIIVLEEIDIIINKIHNNISDHKYIPIQIQNKSGWNSWFDKLDNGFYPHVYIIMTTNKSINYFDELDKSYMRNNRINLKAELHTNKQVVIICAE
jgi:Cdc6-like AAA superfamily ATPase